MIADKNIPAGFQAMIKSVLCDETAQRLLDALTGTEPDTSIRLNRRKSDIGELPYPDMTSVEWCSSGYYLPERPVFTFDPLLHAGVYYVQDASSMIYETIIRQIAGEAPLRVADLCAAPGGKTTAILNALPEGSTMLANEYIPARAKVLKENLMKYGYPHTVVTNADVKKLSGLQECFEIVAVDAPCSGEGMMRKEEVARTQWSEGLVRQCAALQREILESAAAMTAPGGYLIYSTCTFNTTEDEDNAAWIADTLGLEPVDTGLAGKYGVSGEVKGNVPCLRFMPGYTRGEGLFVAVFRKTIREEADCVSRKSKKESKNDRRNDRQKIDKALLATAEKWIEGEYTLRRHESRLLALSQNTATLLDALPSGVRILSAGVEICEAKGKDIVPSHPLAMSTSLKPRAFADVPLTREEALRYLSREAVILPEGTPKGYVTVSYKGHILGFAKHLGSRSNNLYPQDYRIRTQAPTSK